MLRIEALTPAIGAEITGLDLSKPLSDGIVTAIRNAFLEHLVVFFREQRLAPPALLRFAQYFGELDSYPFVAGMLEYPHIVEVIKREHETQNFGGIWHSDTAYLERPPMASILYAKKLPPVGGDTLFANMYLAYETLSQGMKRALASAVGINSADKADAAATRVHAQRARPGDTADIVTRAEHPVVRTHPETGRKALYVNRGHTLALKGFSDHESALLLGLLFKHQTTPELCCRFRWSPGALAFWDNRAAQHNALNDYQGYRRHMQRVTLAGDKPR